MTNRLLPAAIYPAPSHQPREQAFALVLLNRLYPYAHSDAQARTEVSLTSISNISNHACKQTKIHGTKPFHEENVASESRSERPSLLCQEQIDIMIKLATSSYE
jgi:hypothetical protein